MKNLLLFISATVMLIASIPAQAQTYNVSTDVEKKNILLEEFTGINCGNCPSAHKIVKNILNAQGEVCYAIAIHSGYYAEAKSDQPDFTTEEGEEIDEFIGVSGYPSGMVNRHIFAGTSPISSRAYWNQYAKELNAEDAPVNLWMNATYKHETRELVVDIEGYYTANVNAEENYLSVVLTENNIQGPQAGGGVGDEYIHQHMLRDYLTPVWGDTLTAPAKGTFFSKKYTYVVPEAFKETPPQPAEFEVVAFVCNNKLDVLNVTGMKPVCEGLDLPLAAQIEAYRMPIKGTYGFNFFELYLMNKANTPLTSADFSITINDKIIPCSWSGEIAPLATAAIQVPIDIDTYATKNSNDYAIQLTGLNGETFNGNKLSGYFSAPVACTPHVSIELRTDLYADDNVWCIKDADGNVIHTFGPYEVGVQQVYNEEIDLEKDKVYCFEVTDAWANGVMTPRGYYKIYNDSHDMIAQQLEIDLHGSRAFFRTSTEAGIEQVTAQTFLVRRLQQGIAITPASGNSYTATLYSMACNTVYNATLSGSATIPVAAKGIYILQIKSDNGQQVSKISIH